MLALDHAGDESRGLFGHITDPLHGLLFNWKITRSVANVVTVSSHEVPPLIHLFGPCRVGCGRTLTHSRGRGEDSHIICTTSLVV